MPAVKKGKLVGGGYNPKQTRGLQELADTNNAIIARCPEAQEWLRRHPKFYPAE